MELSPYAQHLLETRYLQEGEKTWEDLIRRVAHHAAPDDEDRSEWYYEVISRGDFVPSRMPLMGTRIPFASSCFVLGPIEDSRESIFSVLTDMSEVEAYGGGCGYNFSRLRPEGAAISTTRGKSSGPCSFMQLYNAVTKCITRSGLKGGAQMAVLNVDHPDIVKFIYLKDTETDMVNFNTSVALTDDFMQAVKEDGSWELVFNGKVYGNMSARWLFGEIAEHAWGNGEPGVIFMDTVNRNNPFDEPIEACNPCWTGDTKIWTVYGPKSFSELAEAGEDVPVLTQDEDRTLCVRMMRNIGVTKRSASLMRIVLNDGSVLRCTPDHNIYLRDGSKTMARHLTPGDSISSLYCGKANSKGYYRLTNGADRPLLHHVIVSWKYGRRPDWPREHAHHIDGEKGNNIPENLEIMLASEHNSTRMQGEGNPMFGIWDERNPLYGYDVSKENNPRYRKDIDTDEIKRLRSQGLSYMKIAKIVGCSHYMVSRRLGYLRPGEVNHRVISVGQCNETEDVYNGTVDDTHRYFVMCGEKDAILSANCGEMHMPNNFSCNLGSVNLANVDIDSWDGLRKFEIAIKTGIYFLNDSLDHAFFPLDKVRENTMRCRNIGLGVMGFADYLIRNGIPYDSDEAVGVAGQIGLMLKVFADRAADEYAREHGTRRNMTVTSIAPTGSIATLIGCSYSIEPIFGVTFVKNTVLGPCEDVSADFERIANLRGFYSDALMKQVIDNGSVQALNGVPEDIKALFKTANEIPWQRHVQMQAAWQKNLENAVSKTVNLPNTATVEDVKGALMMAYDLGCKSTTVYRDQSRVVQAVTVGTKREVKSLAEIGLKMHVPIAEPGITCIDCTL